MNLSGFCVGNPFWPFRCSWKSWKQLGWPMETSTKTWLEVGGIQQVRRWLFNMTLASLKNEDPTNKGVSRLHFLHLKFEKVLRPTTPFSVIFPLADLLLPSSQNSSPRNHPVRWQRATSFSCAQSEVGKGGWTWAIWLGVAPPVWTCLDAVTRMLVVGSGSMLYPGEHPVLNLQKDYNMVVTIPKKAPVSSVWSRGSWWSTTTPLAGLLD